ncbi:MAG TPA: hypothetical protein VK797_12135 [Tepidisphaeraceae bacterium]|nr:hypothetical protein [Tepidisphaeraceae bacterium]
MTLTINLSAEAEAQLKAKAAAAGRDAADYAADIVEHSVRDGADGSRVLSEGEQARLSALAEELIRRSEQLAFDSSPPRLKGPEREIEELIVEKFRKQGLQL